MPLLIVECSNHLLLDALKGRPPTSRLAPYLPAFRVADACQSSQVAPLTALRTASRGLRVEGVRLVSPICVGRHATCRNNDGDDHAHRVQHTYLRRWSVMTSR